MKDGRTFHAPWAYGNFQKKRIFYQWKNTRDGERLQIVNSVFIGEIHLELVKEILAVNHRRRDFAIHESERGI